MIRTVAILLLLGAFGAAVYGIAIPLVRIAIWCGKGGCS